MATVRFTKDLIEDIERAATAPFKKKLEEIERSKSFDHWSDIVWRAIMGEHADAVLSLPPKWMRTTSSLTVKVHVVGSYKHIRLSFPKSVPFPHEFQGNEDVPEITYAGYISLARVPKFEPLFEEVRQWVEQKAVIETQQTNMLKGIRELATTYTTLAPALKAWPPLWDLLPDTAKTKHKNVTKREKPEAKVITSDLGSMTAAMAVVKMMGGL
jgi:hypothetical protein